MRFFLCGLWITQSFLCFSFPDTKGTAVSCVPAATSWHVFTCALCDLWSRVERHLSEVANNFCSEWGKAVVFPPGVKDFLFGTSASLFHPSVCLGVFFVDDHTKPNWYVINVLSSCFIEKRPFLAITLMWLFRLFPPCCITCDAQYMCTCLWKRPTHNCEKYIGGNELYKLVIIKIIYVRLQVTGFFSVRGLTLQASGTSDASVRQNSGDCRRAFNPPSLRTGRVAGHKQRDSMQSKKNFCGRDSLTWSVAGAKPKEKELEKDRWFETRSNFIPIVVTFLLMKRNPCFSEKEATLGCNQGASSVHFCILLYFRCLRVSEIFLSYFTVLLRITYSATSGLDFKQNFLQPLAQAKMHTFTRWSRQDPTLTEALWQWKISAGLSWVNGLHTTRPALWWKISGQTFPFASHSLPYRLGARTVRVEEVNFNQWWKDSRSIFPSWSFWNWECIRRLTLSPHLSKPLNAV